MRHPAIDSGCVTSAGDGPAERMTGDVEQHSVGIGGEILSQDQLALRTEMERPTLTVVASLVVSQFRRPDLPRAVEATRRQSQQLPRACPREALKIDQVPDQIAHTLLDGLDGRFLDRSPGRQVGGFCAASQERSDSLQPLEDAGFNEFIGHRMLEEIGIPFPQVPPYR